MQRQDQTTLNVNAEGFISCDSPEHAYLLGFIWANGYILNTKNDIAKLGDLIYEEKYDGIGLERKFNSYTIIKSKINK